MRAASDGFDEVLDAASWVQHLAEAALEPQPGTAGADAACFVLTVLNRLPAGLAQQAQHWLKLHAAVNLRNAAAVKAIQAAID